MPAFVLFEYPGVGVRLSPPAPVTVAEHGVCAEPLYGTELGQVTVVVDAAWLTVSVFEPELPENVLSPANEAATPLLTPGL